MPMLKNPFSKEFEAPSNYLKNPAWVTLVLADIEGKSAVGTNTLEKYQATFVAVGYDDKGEFVHGKSIRTFFVPYEGKQQWVFINYLKAAFRDGEGNEMQKEIDFLSADALYDELGGMPFRAKLESKTWNGRTYLNITQYAPVALADRLEAKKLSEEHGNPIKIWVEAEAKKNNKTSDGSDGPPDTGAPHPADHDWEPFGP